jgi:hypothetical protein
LSLLVAPSQYCPLWSSLVVFTAMDAAVELVAEARSHITAARATRDEAVQTIKLAVTLKSRGLAALSGTNCATLADAHGSGIDASATREEAASSSSVVAVELAPGASVETGAVLRFAGAAGETIAIMKVSSAAIAVQLGESQAQFFVRAPPAGAADRGGGAPTPEWVWQSRLPTGDVVHVQCILNGPEIVVSGGRQVHLMPDEAPPETPAAAVVFPKERAGGDAKVFPQAWPSCCAI